MTEDRTISVTPGRLTSTSGYTITRNKEAVTMSWRAFRIGILALAITAGPLATLAAAQGNTIFMPLLVYRTGPYAPSGIPIANAGSDYFNLLNERDGGINGVKIIVEECETQYDTKQGVECYERLKGKGPLIVNPYSTGIAYQLVPKAAVDKVVVHSMGYGMTASADGRWFPWVFNFPMTYWSQASAFVKYVGSQEGGMDKLKGKKIVHLYLGVAYGKEPNPIFLKQAEKYGFEAKLVEVPAPGTEQQAQWLEIRQYKPDWVILTGFGVMTPAALKGAARVGYPMDHIVGNFWSGSEEDTEPVGEAAKGYISAALNPPGKDIKVIQEIERVVYGAGKGNMVNKARIGSVFYNRGVLTGIMTVEGIRVAQGKFGKKPLTGEQVRWGLEHIKIDDARLAQLGAAGFIQPMTVTCADHEAGGAVKFQQWDGTKWKLITDWIQADKALVRPMVEESATKYAKENNITPRDCSKEG